MFVVLGGNPDAFKSVSELKPFSGSRVPEKLIESFDPEKLIVILLALGLRKGMEPAGNVKSGVTAPGRPAKLGVAISMWVFAVNGLFGKLPGMIKFLITPSLLERSV